MHCRSIKSRFLGLVLTAASALALPMNTQAATYDVLIYADTELLEQGNSRQGVIDQVEELIMETNVYYLNTDITLRANLARVEFLDITRSRSNVQAAELISDISNRRNGFENALNLADEIGADYVYAIVGSNLIHGSKDVCGRAIAVNTTLQAIKQTDRSIAVSELRCGPRTFAHEIGHLMGLAHGNWVAKCEKDSAHKTALTPYARGFGRGECHDNGADQDDVGTIMTGNYIRSTLGSGWMTSYYMVPFFSTSQYMSYGFLCRFGCGHPDYADSTRAIEENKASYASHEFPDVHTFNYDDPKLAECIESGYKYYEVSEMTQISCFNASIRDLSGISQLTELTSLNFASNPLYSVRPILSFDEQNIAFIDLSDINNLPCFEHAQLNNKFGEAKVAKSDSCFPLTAIISTSLLN